MLRMFFLKLFLLLQFNGFLCLRISSMNVPPIVRVDMPVWLNCTLDLESDTLYSVKWYKDDIEFYRYSPHDYPSAQKFVTSGIHLDLEKSAEGHVFLTKSDINTEGLYRCEASADAPSFQTVTRRKQLNVFVPPQEESKIEGRVYSKPEVGIYVSATCKYGPSKPATVLKWYINGKEVMPEDEIYYPPQKHENGLQTSSLGLKFTVKREFVNDDAIDLMCTGSIPGLFSGSIKRTIPLDRFAVMCSDVINFPLEEPEIKESQSKHEIGDYISLTCKSGPSPGVALKWHINGEAISDLEIYFPHENYRNVFEITDLGLKFSIKPGDSFNGSVITSGCIATISNLYSTSSEKVINVVMKLS